MESASQFKIPIKTIGVYFPLGPFEKVGIHLIFLKRWIK